ncbi:MAG TPA: M50 family metallopeptidase [Acidimicrobiales bacterium]|nr:M50 family metallopeptidase [Acidimicrobiales bacterium]
MTVTATRPEARLVHDSGQLEDERSAGALGLLRLAVTVLLIAGLSVLSHKGGAVLVIVAILVMVMLHEFGHFITARWAGMRVTDFFVGFGPTIWSVKRGDTRYGVKAIPAGGFVRVIGMNSLEEIDPEDEAFTYRSKTYWQRLRFASAGSLTHFVIAFVLMVVLLAGFGVQRTTTTLEAVTPGRPAHGAGIRDGDKIVAVNGKPISDWEEVRDVVTASTGRPVDLKVARGDETLSFSLTPVDGRTADEKAAGVAERGVIGIEAAARVVKDSIPGALWHAGFEIKTVTVESAKALFGLVHPDSVKSYGKQLTKTGPADPQEENNRLLSPVGVFRIADASAQSGVAAVLWLLVAINVFVGIFNMLPLPPFDGGHVAVATYEAIVSKLKGRRHMVDMGKLLPVAYVVILGLMALSASALWLDIRHPFDLG